MGAVGIRHKLKQLSMLDQFVDQHFSIGVVDIVVTCSMNIQEIALQVFGMRDGLSSHKIFQVLLRKSHVALLVDVVVGQLIGNSRQGNARLKESRVLE